MLRHSVFRLSVLALGVAGLLLAAAPAQAKHHAKEIRQDQRVTGLALLLDQLNADFVLEFKDRPGRASGRMLAKLGPPQAPSEACAGAFFEQAVVGGSLGEIFNDFSKLLALLDSGVICANLDGSFTTHIEGHYVGGVGFEGATGTFALDLIGAGLTPFGVYPGTASASGSLTGTIVLGD